MKPSGLLTAVALLAVLGGVVWWSNKKQAAATKSPNDSATKILSIPDEQFQEIRIKKLTNEVIDLKRDNGKWQITQPQQLRADQDAVSSVVSALSALLADKVVEDKATDLKPYGLNDPTLDISVIKKDGKTDQVLVGDDVPTGAGAYAKLVSDPRVFTVSSFVKTSLDKTPNDLRDKRLLTFDSEKLTRVELQARGSAVEFGKNGANEWQIVKPRPYRADNSAVDTLVGKLKDAKMDPAQEDPDAAKKFAGAAKVATVNLSDSSGTQSIEVRKDKDSNYFAKSTAVDGIHKIPADVGSAYDRSLDEFRNRKIFDFGFSDPTKLEIKGVTYTKSGDKWTSNGKTMDNISVQSVIDKLRDMTAMKFLDKNPGGNDVMTIVVTSNGGKRTEKVDFRQQVDTYFAQREDDPSIYQVGADVISGLRTVVAGIKEEAPPAKKK